GPGIAPGALAFSYVRFGLVEQHDLPAREPVVRLQRDEVGPRRKRATVLTPSVPAHRPGAGLDAAVQQRPDALAAGVEDLDLGDTRPRHDERDRRRSRGRVGGGRVDPEVLARRRRNDAEVLANAGRGA